MTFVDVHPEHRDKLAQLGLATAADFLRQGGTIVGGHPDRHVLRVPLTESACFLKKEHRISWRDRLAHWWRGFGWISKSTREGRLLRQLEAAGIGCPRAIAFGEGDGRAFLLLREETGLVELRSYLQEQPLERMALAQALGRELARVHAAGFQHRDLYSKHILVGRCDAGWRFCFLDWQRGRRRRRLNWMQRLHDLAALDATLGESMASRQERILCWRAYLAAQTQLAIRPSKLLRMLCRWSNRLQHRRRIRELRQAPLPAGQQGLIWLDGEALCVTPRFRAMSPQTPAWLAMPAPSARNCVETIDVMADGTKHWKLMRRWVSSRWRWLASWWRRPIFPAPEFERAAAIIRLERFGVEVPRLLALGHRTLRPWQKYSFLLTEPPEGAVPLSVYLADAPLGERRRALHAAGRLLRCIHQAGYAWTGRHVDDIAVRPDTGAVVLCKVDDVLRSSVRPDRLARKDLPKLDSMALPELTAADKLRFFLGYHAAAGLTRPMHQLARRLAARRGKRRRPQRERQAA